MSSLGAKFKIILLMVHDQQLLPGFAASQKPLQDRIYPMLISEPYQSMIILLKVSQKPIISLMQVLLAKSLKIYSIWLQS